MSNFSSPNADSPEYADLVTVCQMVGVACCSITIFLACYVGRGLWKEAMESKTLPTPTRMFLWAKFGGCVQPCWPSLFFAMGPFFYYNPKVCYAILTVGPVGYVISKFTIDIFYFFKSRLVPDNTYSILEKIVVVMTCGMPPFGIVSIFTVNGQIINAGTSPSCGIHAPIYMGALMVTVDTPLSLMYLALFIKPLMDLDAVMNRYREVGKTQSNAPKPTRVLITRNLKASAMSLTSTWLAMIWVMLNDTSALNPIFRVMTCTVGCFDVLFQVLVILWLTKGQGSNNTGSNISAAGSQQSAKHLVVAQKSSVDVHVAK